MGGVGGGERKSLRGGMRGEMRWGDLMGSGFEAVKYVICLAMEENGRG